jgi:hypothetical protein
MLIVVIIINLLPQCPTSCIRAQVIAQKTKKKKKGENKQQQPPPEDPLPPRQGKGGGAGMWDPV